jgi:hypothetical protein
MIGFPLSDRINQRKFKALEDVLAFALQALSRQVAGEMKADGSGDAVVECDEREIMTEMVKLSTWAVGKP